MSSEPTAIRRVGVSRARRDVRRPKVALSPKPSFEAVERLFGQGAAVVAGVDEVGRGAWAGPVAVGVAVMTRALIDSVPEGVRDSKLLSEPTRERLFEPLAQWCAAFAIGEASPLECDELGMTRAQALAAGRALAQIPLAIDALVIDGNLEYTGHRGAETLVNGDERCTIVAAASVLAKVTRDRMMIEHAKRFPAYGFERNKGYVSPSHRDAVRSHGMTELHRRRWAVELDVGLDDLEGGSSLSRL